MFCQVVMYKYGEWLRVGDIQKTKKNILVGRPYCWDSGIVRIYDGVLTSGSCRIIPKIGILLFKCSDDKNSDDTKWIIVKNKDRIANIISHTPLHMLDPAWVCMNERRNYELHRRELHLR